MLWSLSQPACTGVRSPLRTRLRNAAGSRDPQGGSAPCPLWKRLLRGGIGQGQEDVPEGSTPWHCLGGDPWLGSVRSAMGQLLALQVLGDQVGFIVLREVVAPHEALLALRALEALVTCGEEQTWVRR